MTVSGVWRKIFKVTCQYAKGSFTAHHDLVQIRSAGFARVSVCFDGADRRCIFLGYDDVRNAAVVSRVLTGAASDHPAAHRGIFEALREMAAGIGSFCSKEFYCIVQHFFLAAGRSCLPAP